MKLNRLQRHTAYIIMLEQMKQQDDPCFCWTWSRLVSENICFVWKELFPEYFKKRTDRAKNVAWPFNNKTERIEALKQCIKETA